MNENTKKIISLYNGELTSGEIARAVGLTPRYVRKIAAKFDLERLNRGARYGKENHQFVSGRKIDLDGYVLVTAPEGHPYGRPRQNRKVTLIFEHRLEMEKVLNRYLLPEETVDHKDGLTLHNDSSNLRLFQDNGEHLRTTITGNLKKISRSGRLNIGAYHRGKNPEPVDIYWLRRERGDVRLRQILLAALSLGIDSPYLLGTHHHLEKVQIDWSSRSNLELALAQLSQRWEEDLAR